MSPGMRIGNCPPAFCRCAVLACRGPFNSAAARYAPPRSVDTLGVEQIYAIKHEGGNRVRAHVRGLH